MSKPAKAEHTGHADPLAEAGLRVWDPVVRLFHWGLASAFALAWFTPQAAAGLHHLAGYVAAGLVTVRLVWGAVGTRHARFADFVRGPRATLAYLAAILRGREARHLGHNPAGAAMIVTLLALMGLTALTGWLEETDAYYGIAWVQQLHSAAAHMVLVLVALHLGGVALASVRHRENLVRSMITGRKRAPAEEDVA